MTSIEESAHPASTLFIRCSAKQTHSKPRALHFTGCGKYERTKYMFPSSVNCQASSRLMSASGMVDESPSGAMLEQFATSAVASIVMNSKVPAILSIPRGSVVSGRNRSPSALLGASNCVCAVASVGLLRDNLRFGQRKYGAVAFHHIDECGKRHVRVRQPDLRFVVVVPDIQVDVPP